MIKKKLLLTLLYGRFKVMRVEVRIKRILAYMERFHYAEGNDANLGRIHGIYDNSPEFDSIVICEEGIYWHVDKHRIHLKYKDIGGLFHRDGKASDDISIRLKNGDIVLLPVRGRRGNITDVFEFTRFLMRVTSDIVDFPKDR